MTSSQLVSPDCLIPFNGSLINNHSEVFSLQALVAEEYSRLYSPTKPCQYATLKIEETGNIGVSSRWCCRAKEILLSELQLAIAYKPPALKPVFSALDVSKWAGLIVIPGLWLLTTLVFLLIPALKSHFFADVGPIFLIGACVYATLGAIFALLTWPIRDCWIKVSKDGVVLPTLVSGIRMTKENHMWSEFVSASLSQSADAGDKLLLGLDTGKYVTLSTKGFDKSELEQLLLGIELWGSSLTRSPELIDYQMNLQNETKGLEVSYTRMWEEELSRRFKATSFLPLDPGHKLQKGKLEVVKQLAFGGLSAIYLAQREGAEVLILKEAVVPSDADPEMRRLAEKHLGREASILGGLSHPNIARVIDHFVEDARHYLLLEYINGQDLRQYIRQNSMQPTTTVISWGSQMADALMFLHGQEPPVVHRDVSPDNIVLGNDGSLVLIDFGASNEFIGTATGTLIGKQAYMASEQLRGKATCQSDIYSLGACLFFLLTGRDPLPLSSCRPSSVVPSITPELDDLIARMTDMEAAKRPATMIEVGDSLSGIAEHCGSFILLGADKE